MSPNEDFSPPAYGMRPSRPGAAATADGAADGQQLPQQQQGRERPNTIVFNTTKNELFRINDNYKILQRKLKGNWRISSNREDSTMNVENMNQVG